MISKPKYGWCNFELGTFRGEPSYLTDVPVDLLDAFINYYNNGYGTVVFDEEGSYFVLTITRYNWGIYIIEEKDKSVLHDFSSMNVDNLAKELIADLEINLDCWAEFITCYDDIEEVELHRDEIKQKIAVLKSVIH